ncbi:hypothetical protein GCM10010530_39970 [Kribbella aluminosa]
MGRSRAHPLRRRKRCVPVPDSLATVVRELAAVIVPPNARLPEFALPLAVEPLATAGDRLLAYLGRHPDSTTLRARRVRPATPVAHRRRRHCITSSRSSVAKRDGTVDPTAGSASFYGPLEIRLWR